MIPFNTKASTTAAQPAVHNKERWVAHQIHPAHDSHASSHVVGVHFVVFIAEESVAPACGASHVLLLCAILPCILDNKHTQ